MQDFILTNTNKKQIKRNIFAEAIWLLNLVFLIALLGCLLTYSLDDNSWSRINQKNITHNMGGLVGAWVADLLLFIFGLSAYWWCALLGYILFLRGKKFFVSNHNNSNSSYNENKLYKHFSLFNFGFILIITSSVGLETLIFSDTNISTLGALKFFELPGPKGGIFGQLLITPILVIFGPLGSISLLCATLAIGNSWFWGFSWFSFFGSLINAIKKLYLFLKQILKNLFFKQDIQQLYAENDKKNHYLSEHYLECIPETVQEEIPGELSKDVIKNKFLVDNFSEKSQVVLSVLPPISLLNFSKNDNVNNVDSALTTEFTARLIEKKLCDFSIIANVIAVHTGPVISCYELELAAGIKGSQVSNLAKDLARSLSLPSIRVVESIANKTSMGLELPNPIKQNIYLSQILTLPEFQKHKSLLALALGKDTAGNPAIVDLESMPHCLIAGTTGSGKSVAINAMIISLLYKASCQEVRLIMIDPKMLELAIYNGIPHLLCPVITEVEGANTALNWVIADMERRYQLMSNLAVRNLASYNQKVVNLMDPKLEPLPYIVIFIDELADLIMIGGQKIEILITRIAQKARAAGIHMILATQRPSVDVITGLIKANIPTRISFQVSSKIDSRTILDQSGAESLLGMGDMLLMTKGRGALQRIHGAFVADEEALKIAAYLKQGPAPKYMPDIL